MTGTTASRRFLLSTRRSLMFSSLLSSWRSAWQRTHARVRGRGRRHPAFTPRVRLLEDRAVPSTLTVTSPLDNGAPGTLRSVLASAALGDTIVFAKKLDGTTITLTQG